MTGTAKEQATTSLKCAKAAGACGVAGMDSISGVIDLALDRLMEAKGLRTDIAVHRRIPPSADKAAVDLPADLSEIANDTDREALYHDQSS